MNISFVVYIDESGDEGFLFGKGSTEWFVLSAVIIHKQLDLETVKLVDDVRVILGRNPAEHDPLHFRKLKHEHRLPFLQHIAIANLKIATVLVHKPSIINVERFQQKNRLYFHTVRLLMERVSWYCRDHKPSEGDGTAEIIFSNRGGMKYEEFREYMRLFHSQTAPFQIEIDWDIIKIDQIMALSSKRMGLQLADAVASSFFFGVQTNQYGFVEDRYTRMLKPITYHHKGRYNGYGLKIFPAEGEKLIKTKSHLEWLTHTYQF